MSGKVSIKNKKASFEYHLIDHFTTGIMLTGTEIKSIRENKASIGEAFCIFINQELYVRSMHIAEYNAGSYNNHETKRDRKLLLNKKELEKLLKKTEVKGYTIVATRLFLSDTGYAKLNIALAQGKKLYDKRESLKEKDSKRDLERLRKY